MQGMERKTQPKSSHPPSWVRPVVYTISVSPSIVRFDRTDAQKSTTTAVSVLFVDSRSLWEKFPKYMHLKISQ